MTSKLYYGLTSSLHPYQIVTSVVKCLGGGDNAVDILLETANQETQQGRYPDKSSYGAGIGLCQCDPIAFTDTQKRTKDSVKDAIYLEYRIEVDKISHRELAYSPLLAFLWCRMHYLLRPDAIPSTLEGRAKYWKKWYNSEKGRGTVEEYMASNA